MCCMIVYHVLYGLLLLKYVAVLCSSCIRHHEKLCVLKYLDVFVPKICLCCFGQPPELVDTSEDSNGRSVLIVGADNGVFKRGEACCEKLTCLLSAASASAAPPHGTWFW